MRAGADPSASKRPSRLAFRGEQAPVRRDREGSREGARLVSSSSKRAERKRERRGRRRRAGRRRCFGRGPQALARPLRRRRPPPSLFFLSLNNNNLNSTTKEFIKISRPAYCRLLRAFRECGPEAERPPKLVGLPAEAQADDDAEVEAAAADAPPSPPPSLPLPLPPLSCRLPLPPLRHAPALQVPGRARLPRQRRRAPSVPLLAKTSGDGPRGVRFARQRALGALRLRLRRRGRRLRGARQLLRGGQGGGATAARKERDGGERTARLSANKLLLPAGGSVLVNPPFEPGLLLSAARCCVRPWRRPRSKGTRLAVVFVGPRWSSSSGGGERAEAEERPRERPRRTKRRLLLLSAPSPRSLFFSSTCLEHSFTVAAAQHGYRDGAPHAARDPYRRSPFDSARLPAALEGREGEEASEGPEAVGSREVREAFKLCLPSAEAAERQRAARGARTGRGGVEGGGGRSRRREEGETSVALVAAGVDRGSAAAERAEEEGKRRSWSCSSLGAESFGEEVGEEEQDEQQWRWEEEEGEGGGGGGGGGGEAKKQKK